MKRLLFDIETENGREFENININESRELENCFNH